jgi:hypothetical protein
MGRFQMLYSILPNDLYFYVPREDSAGVISKSNLGEGKHAFRIVSTDRGGNTVEVTGTMVISDPPRITATSDSASLRISFQNLTGPTRAMLSGRKWSSSRWTSESREVDPTSPILAVPRGPYDLLKVETVDEWGSSGLPYFYCVRKPDKVTGSLGVEHETTASFVRIQMKAEGTFTAHPVVTVYEGEQRRRIPAYALDTDRCFAVFVPDESFGGIRRVVVSAEVNGQEISAFDEFEIYPLRAGSSGTYFVDGGQLIISFDSTSVLRTVNMEILKSEIDGEPT